MNENPLDRQPSPRLEDLDSSGTLFEGDKESVGTETSEEERDRRRDEENDKRGNYTIGDVGLGLREPPERKEPTKRHVPGKPIHYSPPGNVTDPYNRPDNERVDGLIRPQTSEEQEAFDRALPDFLLERDAHALSRIQNEYKSGEINYLTARARVYSHYAETIPIESVTQIFEEYFGDGVYYSTCKPIIIE